MPKIINFGPFPLHLYGAIFAVAVLAGWYTAKKRAHLYKIDREIFDGWILLVPLLVGLIFARVYHVLDYWSVYSKDLIKIIEIQNGGLAIWGGLFGSFLGFFYVSLTKRIKFFSVLDLAAPSLALGQAIGRIGNWINQEGFGPPTTLPWGVYIDHINRPNRYILSNHFHPTFFYEAIANLVIFLMLVVLSKRFRRPGQTFALYLMFYGTVRFFMEFLRIDTWQLGQIKIAQIISIIAILVGVMIFTKQRKLGG